MTEDIDLREYTKNDIIIASVTKNDEDQNTGVTLVERGNEGKIYVYKVEKDSLFDRFSGIEKNMRVLKFQDKPVEDYAGGIKQIQFMLNNDMDKLELEVAKVRTTDEIFKMELKKTEIETRREFRDSTEENYPKGYKDDYGDDGD